MARHDALADIGNRALLRTRLEGAVARENLRDRF